MNLNVPSLLRVKPRCLAKLGKYLKEQGWTRVALLWGEGVKALCGPTVEVSLAAAGLTVLHEETVSSNAVETLFAASLAVPPAAEAVVALGGGKALDAGKYWALLLQKPLAVVPTAVSNDGFCSPSSSLTVGGRRRSLKTVMPEVLVLDTEILAGAPEGLWFSGIGDLFCKATALWDWKYAFRSAGEPVNDFAAVLARNAVDTFLHCHPKDRSHPEYLRVVASSLMMCGLAMAAAGSSRPASGAEHLVSHAYDETAGRPSWHGHQVGAASLLLSLLQKDTAETVWRCAADSGFLAFAAQHPLDRESFRQALHRAPSVKERFVTVLSRPGALAEAETLLDREPRLQPLFSP